MNRYAIKIELPVLNEQFTWEVSEGAVKQLQYDIARGELGPARILSITPLGAVALAA